MTREPFKVGQEVLLRAKFVGESHIDKTMLIFNLGDVRVWIYKKNIGQLLVVPPASAELDALEREALEELIKYRTHPTRVRDLPSSWHQVLTPAIVAVDKVLAARPPKSPAQQLAEVWNLYNQEAEDNEYAEALGEAILAAVQALEKQEKS